MQSLLLITEQPRVRQLFAGLEREGLFRLRVAPTLSQAEEQLTSRLSHLVLVENGTSGLPAAEIVRFLRGLLTDECQVVLLARCKDDLAAVVQTMEDCYLDLSEPDQVLGDRLRALLAAAPPAIPDPAAEPATASEPAARDVLFSSPASVASKAEAVTGASGVDRRRSWRIPLVLLAIVCVGLPVWQIRDHISGPPPVPAAPNAVTEKSARAEIHAIPATPPTVSPKAASSGTGTSPRRETAPMAEPKRAAANAGYLVQAGDSVVRIMTRRYGYSYREAIAMMPEVKRLNGGRDLEKLIPGETLLFPPRPSAVPPAK